MAHQIVYAAGVVFIGLMILIALLFGVCIWKYFLLLKRHPLPKNMTPQIMELEKELFKQGAMLKPPCFICGYDGKGYFDPEQHLCAQKHHKFYSESNAGNK